MSQRLVAAPRVRFSIYRNSSSGIFLNPLQISLICRLVYKLKYKPVYRLNYKPVYRLNYKPVFNPGTNTRKTESTWAGA